MVSKWYSTDSKVIWHLLCLEQQWLEVLWCRSTGIVRQDLPTRMLQSRSTHSHAPVKTYPLACSSQDLPTRMLQSRPTHSHAPVKIYPLACSSQDLPTRMLQSRLTRRQTWPGSWWLLVSVLGHWVLAAACWRFCDRPAGGTLSDVPRGPAAALLLQFPAPEHKQQWSNLQQ